MEYLVFAVILYFILQTAGNLVYFLRGGGGAGPQSPAESEHNWKGPSPRAQTDGLTEHPTFWGEDVEDASWWEIEE